MDGLLVWEQMEGQQTPRQIMLGQMQLSSLLQARCLAAYFLHVTGFFVCPHRTRPVLYTYALSLTSIYTWSTHAHSTCPSRAHRYTVSRRPRCLYRNSFLRLTLTFAPVGGTCIGPAQ